MYSRFHAAWLLALAGCASSPAMPPLADRVAALLPADALLVGEQHDAGDHQRIQRETVQSLARRGQLAALALEMAERGRSTAGLPPQASEAEVKAALAWNDQGWPWERYGPVAMAAVRAGVPVLGANLPRSEMRAAMQDATLDARLAPERLAQQREAIREGHCNQLPEGQIAPMARIQIARDIAMAQTLASARQPGRTVLLVAGGGHVPHELGVPRHLPADVKARVLLLRAGPATDAAAGTAKAMGADLIEQTPALPPVDYCAALRK